MALCIGVEEGLPKFAIINKISYQNFWNEPIISSTQVKTVEWNWKHHAYEVKSPSEAAEQISIKGTNN